MSKDSQEGALQGRWIEILVSSASVFLAGAVSISFFSFANHFNLHESLSVIAKNIFPFPRVNGFYGKNTSAYQCIYATLLLAIIFVKVFECLFHKFIGRKTRHGATGNSFSLLHVTLMIFIAVTSVQFKRYLAFLTNEYVVFHEKSFEQKKEHIFGLSYTFAQACKKHLAGEHSGWLITDMDITKPDPMTEQRLLSYFLYPIRIRKTGEDNPDCLIYYAKKDAARFVPDNYVIRYQFDRNNLFAVRKTGQK